MSAVRETAGRVVGENVSQLSERVVRLLGVLPRYEAERIARTLYGSLLVLFPDLGEDDKRA